jgi:hypothetical protein
LFLFGSCVPAYQLADEVEWAVCLGIPGYHATHRTQPEFSANIYPIYRIYLHFGACLMQQLVWEQPAALSFIIIQ